MGGSDRGPTELDTAVENRGIPEDDVTIGDEDEEALSAGATSAEVEHEEARRRPEGGAAGHRRQEEPPARAPDDEAEAAARGGQPGGDRPSESERPDGTASRWGAGEDPDSAVSPSKKRVK